MTSIRCGGFVDPGWEHGTAQDEKKKKVRCNYCGKVVSGGIYRLKQHIARVSGEVTYCDKAPEEACLKMKENLQGCRIGKKPKQIEYEEHPTYINFPPCSNDSNDVLEEEHLRTTASEYGTTTMSAAYDNSNRNKGKKQQQLVVVGVGVAVGGDKGLVINMAPPPPPLRSLGYVDPGWEHGVPRDERKKKVKCNYCDKIVSGGINRFKQHLARIPGEVAPCKSAPEEVYLKIKENMKWHRTGRRHRRPEPPPQSKTSSSAAYYMMHSENENENDDDDDEEEEDVLITSGDKRKRFVRREEAKPKSQANNNNNKISVGGRKEEEVMSAISKFFYHAGVPPHAASSPYFHKMLEMVSQYGPPPPSSLILSSSRYLQEEIVTVKACLAEYKASWAVTGCSILADTWKDANNRTLIDFLVSCPRGLHFLSSVDATEFIEDAPILFKLLDKVVDDIGEENVVQVITRNTPSYEAAGKMLEEKRQNLFWTPCAASCIEQMLEDFVKIKWVAESIERGQKITKLVYNHAWLVNLMRREYTRGQELVRASFSSNASTFLTLQTLMDHRVALKRLFQSTKWLSSRLSKSHEGEEVEKIVMNGTFWKKVQYVRRSVEPILEVLKKMSDSDVSIMSMPYIYNDICEVKIAIKSNHGDDQHKYGNLWSIIDGHSLTQPLHLAAYFLNPSYRYRSDSNPHPEVIRALNSCIVRFEPNNARRVSASKQISDFVSAKADFGTDLAISTRTELNPAAWWQQHGINCVELQQIAVRILSQTCSCIGCEHSWSIYDEIRNPRHNRLTQKRLNDFIYLHYNLRLKLRKTQQLDPSSSASIALQEHLLYEWIVNPQKQQQQASYQEDSDEEEVCSEMEYENGGLLEYEQGNGDSRKDPLIQPPLDSDPPHNHNDNDNDNDNDNNAAADDDDDDDEDGLNFLDDDDDGL